VSIDWKGDVTELILVDGQMVFQSEEGTSNIDFRPSFKVIERSRESMQDLFPAAFSADDRNVGARVTLFSPDHHGSVTHFNLSWTTTLRGPLPWLRELRHDTELLELDGGSILCRLDDSQKVWIDLESGFPRRAELEREEGGQVTYELAELEVDLEFPDETFDLSEFDTDEPAHEDLGKMPSALVVQQRLWIFVVLCRHFDSDTDVWDEDDVRSVFTSYHEAVIDFRYAAWAEQARERTEAFGETLAEHSAELDTDEVERRIALVRGQIQDATQRGLENHLELSEPRLPEDTPTDYLHDMLDIELEAAEAAFLHRVAEPQLEYFDQVVEANRQD
jgi:hypothetical protein